MALKLRSGHCVILIATLTLYGSTLARNHTWDAIAYTATVHGDPVLSERYLSTSFFHPHHLLFNSLAWLFVRGSAPLLGDNVSPFLPLQIMNALFGSLCALLMYLLCCRRFSNRLTALFLAGSFAISNSIWLFSTEVEVMLPALFFLLLSIYVLTLPSPHAATVVFAAVLAALSVLMHQITGFGCVALVFYLTLLGRRGVIQRNAPLVFTLVLILIVGCTYVTVTLVVLSDFSVPVLVDWMTEVSDRSAFGKTSRAELALSGTRGLVNAFLSPFGPAELRVSGLSLFSVSLLLATFAILLAGVTLCIRFLFRARSLLGEGDPWAHFLLLWIVLTSVFIIWFQPTNVEYWLYCVPPILLLVGESAHRWGTRRAVKVLTLGVLVSMGVINLSTSIRPRMDETNAEYHTLVTSVEENMTPGDVIIAGLLDHGGFLGIELLAIPFYTGVDVVMLSAAEVPGFVETMIEEGRDVFLREVIQHTLTPALLDTYNLETEYDFGDWRLIRVRKLD